MVTLHLTALPAILVLWNVHHPQHDRLVPKTRSSRASSHRLGAIFRHRHEVGYDTASLYRSADPATPPISGNCFPFLVSSSSASSSLYLLRAFHLICDARMSRCPRGLLTPPPTSGTPEVVRSCQLMHLSLLSSVEECFPCAEVQQTHSAGVEVC